MFFSKTKPEELTLSPVVRERRRSGRNATVMQVAKYRLADGREELCLLRDVSPEGLKAELYVEVALGTSVQVELRTGQLLDGKIASVDAMIASIAFGQPVPLSALLAHCSFDDRLGKPRPPRLVVNFTGLLCIDFEEKSVRIGNISQAGMQIEAPGALPVGAPCAIALPGLAPRPATVRWSREGDAGLMLSDPFDYAEFSAWRASLTNTA